MKRTMTDDIPRRCQLEHMTPAERAIYDAMGVVEAAGCDVQLTEAVNLLQKARDRVADFVDGVEHPLVSYPKSEPEVLLQVIAEREDWRMREGRAQHETSLAQKRIKSLEDGIVAENRRTSVIEQELQAVKDVLIARDEDFHPDNGLATVAEVVARILNERDRVRDEYEVSLSRVHEEASTATDILCGALGPDHGRSGLVEHCQKAADKIKELERDFATLAALNKSNADELARQMDLRERGVPAPRFTDSRQQAIAEALLTWRRVELSAESVSSASASRALRRRAPEPAGDLRRAVGRLVVGGYGGSRRDSIALTFANRADVRRDVVLLRDQLAAWLEDRRRTTIFLSGEWRDTSDGDPSGGADVLPDHDDSGGSGAAQADVAQRGQSNEGTHGPLDRPASPEPARRSLRSVQGPRSYGEGETQGTYANESPCPACASQPVATFKTRSVHAEWAEPPKPYTKPKLTELVSREQLVAACKKAGTAYGNVYQTIFEALVKALEDS